MTSPGPECTCTGPKKPQAVTSRRLRSKGKVTRAGNLQSADGQCPGSGVHDPSRQPFSHDLRKVKRNRNFMIPMPLFDLTKLDRIVRPQCSNLRLAAEISIEIPGLPALNRRIALALG